MAGTPLSPGWATYLRVSDEDKQSPERSFAFQRKNIHDHLLTPSEIPFKKEYCEMLTGKSPNRKDYQQMLADAEAGLFSIWDLSSRPLRAQCCGRVAGRDEIDQSWHQATGSEHAYLNA